MADRQAEQWEIDTRIKDALKQNFRPEFLNRIDEIVIFHSLSKENLAKIVDIQLRDVAKRLADRQITLDVSDAAEKFLGELGWDPAFGARPLKRVIQQQIENGLAQRILAGEVADGDLVNIDATGKSLTFDVVRDLPGSDTSETAEPSPDETVVEGELIDE